MENKKPWQSKTLLVNGVLGAIAFIGLFVPGAESIGAWINSHGGEVAMGWSMINMVLRLITKDKIQLGE